MSAETNLTRVRAEGQRPSQILRTRSRATYAGFAFGLTLPFQAALVLFVVLQVGAVPPSLPGRLGVFNYLTVLTLSQYGVDPSMGLSYSIALYVVAMLSKLVWGTVYLARGDLWREMPADLVA